MREKHHMAGEPERNVITKLYEGWEKPERTYKPHTRWWWPGNALTKDDVTYQMEQMASQGMGGVEIMNTWKYYEKGNHEYLSPEHIELVKHAVAEGKRLNIEVSITFSPGWSFGGGWVEKRDTSKSLVKADVDIIGPINYNDLLPAYSMPQKGNPHANDLKPEMCKIIAVVAARVKEPAASDNKEPSDEIMLEADSLTVLTSFIKDDRLFWDVPEGHWRIMAFYLMYTGQVCQANNYNPPPTVIDHLSKGAVERYCNYLGSEFEKHFGCEFGKTIDSFFCDSFEVMSLPNGLLWSEDVLAGFKQKMGYDFTPYLPAIWYDVCSLTPYLRYDINYYLHQLGLETFFKTFNDWCNEHDVQARVQPHYRFTTELIQAAGSIPRPETEVTTARFATIPDPRKSTASGARLYGNNHLSAESYTFINRHRYRTELKQLKIATDAFLRDGVTQLYNHGYFAAPEEIPDPTRHVPWANLINHQNVWWKYYRHLTEYIARCCFMLRQGRFISNILIYSPQAKVWSDRTIWEFDRRIMPYGNLPMTLVANGYDYDLVNDDLLQNHAYVKDGHITINHHSYRVLILPDISILPLKTMEFIYQFAQNGGVVIALGQIPQMSAGLIDREIQNAKLKQITEALFEDLTMTTVYHLPDYMIGETVLNPGDQEIKPMMPLNGNDILLLKLIGEYIKPDMAIENRIQSDGLTFIHRKWEDVDIYFVTNLQPKSIKADITFRVKDKVPQKWDSITGKISNIEYRYVDCKGTAGMEGTVLSLEFNEWESAFLVFTPSHETMQEVKMETASNQADDFNYSGQLDITGTWHMKLEGHGFDTYECDIDELKSWTSDKRTIHYAGTGRYDIDFNIPEDDIKGSKRLLLDLGNVGMIAEAVINEINVGTAWMPPYKLEITDAVKVGKNHLTIFVTNVWLNYINGLKEPTQIPKHLQGRLGIESGMDKDDKQWLRLLSEIKMDEKQLPPSGLMGPVRIIKSGRKN